MDPSLAEEKKQVIHELIRTNTDSDGINEFYLELKVLIESKEIITPDEFAEAVCNLIFDPLT